MTTSPVICRPVVFSQISSNQDDMWNHPMLDLFRQNQEKITVRQPLLYSIPSNFGEEFDPDFAPQPTSAANLPDLREWTLKFAISALEIMAAKRQPAQLARWCHHTIYAQLVSGVGSLAEVGRVRKLHMCQPLDGISESALTIRFNDRIRSLVMRFEGVDHRWLCTSLTLL